MVDRSRRSPTGGAVDDRRPHGTGLPPACAVRRPQGRRAPLRPQVQLERADCGRGAAVAVVDLRCAGATRTRLPGRWRADNPRAGGRCLHDIGYLINHEKHPQARVSLFMHGATCGVLLQRRFESDRETWPATIGVAPPKKTHANLARLDRGERRLVRRLFFFERV